MKLNICQGIHLIYHLMTMYISPESNMIMAHRAQIVGRWQIFKIYVHKERVML